MACHAFRACIKHIVDLQSRHTELNVCLSDLIKYNYINILEFFTFPSQSRSIVGNNYFYIDRLHPIEISCHPIRLRDCYRSESIQYMCLHAKDVPICTFLVLKVST